jgi:hypothetical protein
MHVPIWSGSLSRVFLIFVFLEGCACTCVGRRRIRMDMRFGAFHGGWNFHTLRVDLDG